MDVDSDIPFIKLLTDHQPVICSFVISLLPGAPGVDDVIQETNVVLWKKRDQFELGTNFRAWALTIARFQVMAHLRDLRQRRWVTLDEDVAQLLAEELIDQPDPEFTERRFAALSNCLLKLRPEDRDLLMQRYWRRIGLQDFATSRQRSLSGLKVQLFRLRAALKRCVENQMSSDPTS
ncbi:sigma-70 family RNA polymerase sigma factor [Luteolibacter pohnpeiensis]|uniref:Sigma-70 family RNA polymerase sigma factor n=1 Tax=Luteolibacter pohnpeiensis TaxID=454153 RepID=A0A934VV59_9BACT|nr:sigma-70 family RNA polymerase sigma factor [Luteolibacter pohnpeiensis]MBK1881453.1 sigma-70 family RNA polymerase sigma factor [Luteolibacter pohnpeiensis]